MTAHRSLSRRAAAVAATATGALVLTACGGNGGTSDGRSDHAGPAAQSAHKHAAHKNSAPKAAKVTHNAADVTFAQAMITHHRQAVEMAALAASHASSPKVKGLAVAIQKEQGPEIKKMSGWLKSWKQDVPPVMPGTDQSGDLPGMMKPADMAKLKKSSGKDFDKDFLQMMTAHHKGSVSMAGTEKAKGSYKPAKDTATDIATSQTGEIKQMKSLLGA